MDCVVKHAVGQNNEHSTPSVMDVGLPEHPIPRDLLIVCINRRNLALIIRCKCGALTNETSLRLLPFVRRVEPWRQPYMSASCSLFPFQNFEENANANSASSRC